MSLLLALRNLRRQFRRSLTALLSIGFGVAALLVATGFNAAMFEEFREATIRSQFGHLQITRPGFQERGRSDPWAYLLPGDLAVDPALLPPASTVSASSASGTRAAPPGKSSCPSLARTAAAERGDRGQTSGDISGEQLGRVQILTTSTMTHRDSD